MAIQKALVVGGGIGGLCAAHPWRRQGREHFRNAVASSGGSSGLETAFAGRPPVEVDMRLQNGKRGRGVAPAGASRNVNEAVDLRDGGPKFGGLDVTEALAKIKGDVASALIGMGTMDQRAVDGVLIALDGTSNKSDLGGNATVAISMAVMRAAAASEGTSLWRYLAGGKPVRLLLPVMQIFGGGAYAGRRVDIQDFLVMPVGAESFTEAMEIVYDVNAAAGELMARKGPLTGVANEGGYWRDFDDNEEALGMLTKAIESAGYGNGEVMISLDIAASEFHKDGKYILCLENRFCETDAWIEELSRWIATYPILSIKDPVDELDEVGMVAFTKLFGDRIQIIGDDYLVTSAARAKGCGTIVSARSGETEDAFISDLSTGWDAGQLKVGAFTRSERLAKWNQVQCMEDMLGGKAVYAGGGALPEGLQ